MLNLLIVDDDDEVLEAFSDALSSDFKIFTATDGLVALEKASRNHIHLVVADYNMPNLDGLELLRALKQREIKTPVIILSGGGGQEVEQQALSLGAFDYVEKPCSLDFLKTLLFRAAETSMSPALKDDIDGVHTLTSRQITFNIPHELYLRFNQHCRKKGLSVEVRIRQLIKEELNSKNG